MFGFRTAEVSALMRHILFMSEINTAPLPSTSCGGGSAPSPVQSGGKFEAEEEEGKSAKENFTQLKESHIL